MKRKITLTKAEQKAIKQLENWAKRCPKTLWLFGQSGTLQVLKRDKKNRFPCVVADNFAVDCDGGDSTPNEIDQNPCITYED